MILVRVPSTRCLANEVSMPFLIRPFHRFPVHGAVTYNEGSIQSVGTLWNFSEARRGRNHFLPLGVSNDEFC